MSNLVVQKLESLTLHVTDGEHGSVVDDNDSNYYLLSNKNIINGKIIITKDDRKISEESFKKINKRTRLDNGDIVISTVGVLGKTAIIREKVYYDFQRSVGIIKVNPQIINNKFLYYYLNTKSVIKRINDLSKGAVQKCFFISDLKDLDIHLFNDLPTQQKIASVLSALDDKIELNNKINAELEAMAKTLYDYWFVQFEFPNAEGKPYKSSGGAMEYNTILKRELPKGWEVKTIGDLGSVYGGSTPSKSDDAFFTNDGTPWITPKDLSRNIGNKFISNGELDVTDLGIKNASLNILPERSVLMSSRAPVGYLAINSKPCTTNQGFKSIVCDKGFNCEFVFYVLQSNMSQIEANATGSTFKEISSSVFKSLKILLPPFCLIKEFENKASTIFQKQLNTEKQNQELAALRDWLLPMLMNGQVKVS